MRAIIVHVRRLDKKAFRRSIWSSISRLIGVALGAGAGSLIHQLIGGGFSGWGVALAMAAASFVLMAFAEYEREKDE
jgi:uncharacterized membrane protein YgaE (UPF0421/DUF939 family)